MLSSSEPRLAPERREFLESESEIHLADYLQIVVGRWRLIALLTFLCLGGGLLHYLITPKDYRASTSILIERRVLVPLQSAQDAMLENYYNMEFYPTQYKLLASRGLAERVVQSLRLDQDPSFNPGRAARPIEGTRSYTAKDDEAQLGALASRLLGGLAVNPVRNTQLVEITYTSRSPELAARIANAVADAYIDWGIENRASVAGKASVFLGSQIEQIKQEIQDKENQLLAYSRRADIVPLDSGSNVTLQRLEALNQDYIRALSDRISREARLRELEGASKERAAEILEDPFVSQLRGELLQMERDYSTRLNTYKPEWPAMQELRGKIEKARQNLDTVIGGALSKARESARSEYQTALRREQALSGEINQLKAENREVNSAAVEYNNLRVEITTRRTLLDELLRRQSQSDVTSRLQETRESNVRVVDRALVPGGPFRPSLRRDLSLGLGVGLMIGLVLAFLLHYLDRTVKTGEEVERQFGLPILAVIPDVSASGGGYGLLGRYGYGYGYGYGHGYGYGYGAHSSKDRAKRDRKAKVRKVSPEDEVRIELLPHTRPRLAVAEAYRGLRTALLLSSARELKTVVITSANPGEGKTSTVTNLAVVFAQLGRNVLLLDADLRKPRVHEIFKISNRVGLVSYLTGAVAMEQIIFRSDLPNLFLTPSGPIPPNPSELLASERMQGFLDLVRSRFDIAIIDTAPTLAVTDSTLVGSLSDGVVICMRAGNVQREDVRACRDRLLQSEVRILGAVLNRFRARAHRYKSSYAQYEAYGGPEPKTDTAATA